MSAAVAGAEVEPPNGAVRDLTAEIRKMRGDYRLFAVDRCAVCGGSLFDGEEEEEDRKKKKKEKKDKSKKKGDEEDDGDGDTKTKKKKKKGVFRLLHRGKDKAGGLLDGLQYEGDELQRKKAKRQAKRDEREGKPEPGALTSKKGSVERVVSEGRLGGSSADRRGRTRPGRSRTMSSIPSASTARIICRHCERGEKRRSWGTVREEALAAGAPAHRLYEELSEERELISSLLARFDYLVGSVSPDVGDLLIELFTPQLKEDTATEQLRLVMAETREDDDNAKREDDDSDASQPGQGTRMKKTTTTSATRKPKKSRIMGAATTVTATSSSAADKDGPSAKPAMKLSLGKIFGWNDKSSASSSTSSSSSEGAESGANGGNGKAKRKVMALLPSCYCPIKKADKYEAFFPTFYLEVYKAAEELQKELTMTADTYKAALKLFARLKATVQTARQERLVSNMKIAFVEFIQDKQPEINWLKVKLQSMFVCQASYLFLVLCQLLWEVRKRQSLWKKLGKHCLVTIQVMQSELSSLVISFHKDWDEHKQRIEEIITEYNKLKAEKNKALISSAPEDVSLEDEDLLLNCERIVRECVKQVEFSLGEIGLRATKEALVELVANLVLERAKCNI